MLAEDGAKRALPGTFTADVPTPRSPKETPGQSEWKMADHSSGKLSFRSLHVPSRTHSGLGTGYLAEGGKFHLEFSKASSYASAAFFLIVNWGSSRAKSSMTKRGGRGRGH